ncbi:proton-conducting transporter transmembrane domain-containing protein (plasmid) [Pseudonocardia bannensis]
MPPTPMPPTLMSTGLLATVLLLAPVLLPALTAVAYLAAGWRRSTAWLSAASAAAVLAAVVALAVEVTAAGARTAVGGLLRADALSAFMLLVVAAVALVACVATPAHLHGEIRAGRVSVRTATRHSVQVQVFLATMALAVLAANLGLLWVAVEATTIVTAFLVGQRRTRAAVEAAWKYVVICSTGIALALLGTLLLNYAALHAGAGAGLDWVALAAGAARLDPGVTQIAVVLLILGFGTKAGLAPLHAWLPDAHSQAPAPVSALMSGVLLSVAFYAILRVKVIADAALGGGFSRALLAVVALASLLVAATVLLAQRDYKRMLAYSSIEHMGLLALGAAAGGPLAMAAVLLHMLGHGLAKSTLFLGAGHILQTTGTSRISEVRGLAARAPMAAGCFAAGMLALIGFPPFSVFASEFGIARAGFATGLGWITAAAFALVLVIAAALVGHTGRMLLGRSPDGPGAAAAPRPLPGTAAVTLVGALGVCAAVGISAGPLSTLLHLAADVLTGTP